MRKQTDESHQNFYSHDIQEELKITRQDNVDLRKKMEYFLDEIHQLRTKNEDYDQVKKDLQDMHNFAEGHWK